MFKRVLNKILLFITFIVTLCSCSIEGEPPIEHTKSQLCVYCNKCIDDECECDDKCVCAPLLVTKESFKLYENTIWETNGYLFKTNKEGPGIVIIGGIHGDETAGWQAALDLVDIIENESKICGNILIVPQVNIIADIREERYVGKKYSEDNFTVKTVTIDGVTDKYSDLNRSFELGRRENSSTRTIWLSDGIIELVNDFNTQYGADYIIDLHESRKSWDQQQTADENSQLGDKLIFSNKPAVCRKIISNYNKNYRLENEVYFGNDEASQAGSFSYTMSLKYPNSVVFTIETNRDFYYINSTTWYNNIPLATRVRQQLNMLRSMFDIAWGRI